MSPKLQTSPLLIALCASALLLLAAGCGNDSDDGEADNGKASQGSNLSLLYVVDAGSGTLQQTRGKDGYRLTLDNVSPQVVAFSDRPERLTLNLPTEQFFADVWPGSFNGDPPNAALDLASGGGGALALELSAPKSSGSSVSFEARKLDDATGLVAHYQDQLRSDAPSRFGPASLFVDDDTFCDRWDPQKKITYTWYFFRKIDCSGAQKITDAQQRPEGWEVVTGQGCGGPASQWWKGPATPGGDAQEFCYGSTPRQEGGK